LTVNVFGSIMHIRHGQEVQARERQHPLSKWETIVVDDCCGPSAISIPLNASVSESDIRLETPDGNCPSCGQKGRRVDTQTVKALLAISLAQVTHEAYLFCRQPDCPVVYYSADGAQHFTTEQIRERVYQKEAQSPDVFICYCFRHTPASISDEIERTGRSTVVEEITKGTQAGYCACDIRNPKGACCLGDVRALVKQLLQTKTGLES
jgi:hypothetical protein